MICFGESKEKKVMKSNEVMYSIILCMYIWYIAYESTGYFLCLDLMISIKWQVNTCI